MGLLDALFQSDSYGGPGGGLLDLIRNSQMQQQNYQPSAGFPTEAPAASFADRFRTAPNAPPIFSPAPDQAQPISVGGYQMPRIGAADQFQPQQAMLPQNAQPAQGQLPQAPVAPPQAPQAPQQLPPALGGNQDGSFIDNLARGFRSVGNGGGIISALRGQPNDPQSIAQQNLSFQYSSIRKALIDNGETPQAASSKAMVAAMNPEAAKTILPELFTNKTELKMVKDALGAEHPYSWNSREQTLKPVGENGEGSSGTSGGVSLLAPGVKQFNPNLSGEDYINQFGPEVKAAVKSYINGDVMPTGNPRAQAIATKAKEIAQKYGQDTGTPVSDALYSEKRKYRTELGTNSPNSAGGQAKAFNQGISHLTSLADNLEKLDNSNGFGIPAVAGVVNAVRQGASVQQSAISDEAKTLGQTVAGEVGKLFSGAAGGGVHERELTRERFDTVKSKPQMAAALRATLETMDGGLKALEQRRDSVLGPNSGVELVSAETKANIAKIQGAIDRLEGKASAAPAGGVQEGATATNPQTGAKITFRNGKWQ